MKNRQRTLHLTQLSLLIAMVLFCKSARIKQLSRLAFVPGIFNINEPIVFGLPIVMNPVIIIPFILVPTLNIVISYFAMDLGIVPICSGVQVPWTMPLGISGLIATNWVGGVLQILLLIMGVFIYLPFIKTIDNQYLHDEQLAAEQAANEIVWRDEGVECAWPSPQELAAAEYRSKKALEGPVRLVTIPDADCCACCGTHLPRTGMVGQIKLLDWQRYKGGMRLTAVCGGRALADYRIKRAQLADAGALLSVPMNSVAPAAHRLAEENAALKQALAAAENQWFEALAAQVTPDQAPLVLAPGLSGESLRRLCLTLCQRTARPCAALSAGGMGLAYAVGQADGDVRGLVKALNAALDGRGGGKPAIAMGSLRADFEAVGPVWAEFTHTQ